LKIKSFLQTVSLLTCLYFTCYGIAQGKEPVAVNGVIDIREAGAKDNFMLKLNGDWEFYWNKFLHPSDFRKTEKPLPDLFAKVPAYWTEYKKSIKTTKYGYATYRLVILLPEKKHQAYGFDIPVFDSSFELWVDDTLLYSNGRPGTSEETTVPLYKPGIIKIMPRSDTITVTINVANFHHRRGGFWLPMKFGTFEIIRSASAHKWAGNYASVSILTGFALFFLIFFLMYPRDKLLLSYSLALIGLALRPFFTSDFLIYDFTSLSWNWTIKMEYISSFIAIFGWTWYNFLTFPLKINKYAAISLSVLIGTSILLSLLTPVKIFSYTVFIIYICLVTLLSLALFSSIRGLLKRNTIDAFYLGLFILISFGVTNDILVSLGKAYSSIGYIMPHILVAFVFLNSILIIYRWVQEFKEKEKLRIKLKELNRNLEEIVAIRTAELKARNEEIVAKNLMIEKQNLQLTNTINLKNKIFSVIAHDLRGPVVNILYILNLLKDKEYKDNYEKFAESSINYAQMVINLLENMLVWGRSQEDKIKYDPETHELSGLILSNIGIFKESAERKNISINYTQKGNSAAYFDKALVDIIIRNLLSNAVKYTQQNGKIDIILEENNEKGTVSVRVCDNGTGIPEERLKTLFTSGGFETTPGTDNEKGTGIGLKLCHELITINKGTITVKSKEGEGSCFEITLPVKPPDKNQDGS